MHDVFCKGPRGCVARGYIRGVWGFIRAVLGPYQGLERKREMYTRISPLLSERRSHSRAVFCLVLFFSLCLPGGCDILYRVKEGLGSRLPPCTPHKVRQ